MLPERPDSKDDPTIGVQLSTFPSTLITQFSRMWLNLQIKESYNLEEYL